ncbi:amidohydrolase family protein [Micromonospora sp. NPDC048830]|uniref:amidohydrolase family protein n=1 Tax=Micromonospora sp. NPDC048830 TaxID=3364257 RepID=UPI0037233274
MSDLLVRNIGTLLSGDLDQPTIDADAVVCVDGVISAVGREAEVPVPEGEVEVVNARGATVAPGLIDSHCHVVLGDYTPRQKTVDFLESYVHGGITSVISPGEIHAPGRPHEALGVVGLAIAARSCFANHSPGGMRVHAGSVVLEPSLERRHFALLQEAGVRLAKFGFGDYADPMDGVEQVRLAQEHGIVVMCHSGGASVPGSQPITTDHLLALAPDVCGHINGGPTSLPDRGVLQIMEETRMAMQIVQAGNLSSSLRILREAGRRGALDRIVIGSDTPTGTGVMPLGMLKTVAELSSLGELDPAVVWALASGNCADVWSVPGGRVVVGAVADLVVLDAPWGSQAEEALGALAIGDVPGISAVICAGRVRVGRSRNTPAATRQVEVVTWN